jgi:CheY-like chemotaxis protein
VTIGNLVLLCDDLLFSSRITATARSRGIPARTVRNTETLLAALGQQSADCVIVDLANPGLNSADLMTRLKEACTKMPRVVAFGSHVDTATLKAAREAGCDPVWPRSKFAEELETALPAWVDQEAS